MYNVVQIGTLICRNVNRESTKLMSDHRPTRMTYRDLARLGLKEHPFLPSADPRLLQDMIDYGQGLAVVEGHMGTGKTSLARRLFELSRQDDSIEPVYLHTAKYKTPMDTARVVSAAYGVRGRRSYIDQLDDLERYLVRLYEANMSAVVLIDDAQMMEAESLDAIQSMLNFDLTKKLIQIILFGQQEIKNIFVQKPAVHDRVVHWQSLGPLPFSEMVGLINFRLTVAGRSEPLFTDTALTRLYGFSSGVPRPLVIVCGTALRILFEMNLQIADEEVVNEAIEVYEQRPGS
jgi:general secretion pathway protein A